MTPVEFEKKAGKGAQHNWKRTVRSVTHDKKTMYKCIQEGIIKICPNQIEKFDKDCKCKPCMLSKGVTVPKSPESKVPAKKIKKITPIKNKKMSSTSTTSATSATPNTTSLTTTATGENSLMKNRDTASDSGISIEI